MNNFTIIDGDEYPLVNEMNCIEPFTVTDFDGEYKIEVYPRIKKLAVEFAELFGDNPFTEAAVKWLSAHIKPFLDEWNYKEWSDESYTHSRVYVCDCDTPLNLAVIRADTVMLSEADEEINDSGSFINGKSWDGDDYPYAAFGSKVGGRVVSVAADNSHWMDDSETEIGVTTASDYQKMGFAASNVAALCDYKRKNGALRIWYSCASDNIASIKTAEKAGLRFIGNRYINVAGKK